MYQQKKDKHKIIEMNGKGQKLLHKMNQKLKQILVHTMNQNLVMRLDNMFSESHNMKQNEMNTMGINNMKTETILKTCKNK